MSDDFEKDQLEFRLRLVHTVKLRGQGRIRYYAFDDSDILSVLTAAMSGAKRVNLRVIPEIPADAYVQGVHHEYLTRRFLLQVYHESFDVVPMGATVPTFPATSNPQGCFTYSYVRESDEPVPPECLDVRTPEDWPKPE